MCYSIAVIYLGSVLLNKDSVTNYWWDCPSCGTTKISSVLKNDSGDIVGATSCCPECFYTIKGNEETYVDEDVYEIPPHLVEKLQQPRWFCKACGQINDLQPTNSLGLNDLYCTTCETFQIDISDQDPLLEKTSELKKFSPKKEITKTPQMKSFGISGLIALGIFGFGFVGWTNLKNQTIVAEITNPVATSTVIVEEYEMVTRSGWSLPVNAPDFQLLSTDPHRYKETVKVFVRTESYEVSPKRQVCSSVKKGATSVNSCSTVPAVTGTRNIYRDEAVYAPYYTWKHGVWEYEDTLKEVSHDFQIVNPDTSVYPLQEDQRFKNPQVTCSVTLEPENKPSFDHNLDCGLFVQLEESIAEVTYSNWGGIKNISLLD